MELRHLRYFQAVGREEHFGRAAARLRVTQSVLTRQIQDLEHELGIALFERLPRGVRLSAAGRLFLDDVTGILAEVENASIRARSFASGGMGVVRVGYSEIASNDANIPSGMLDFRSAEPGIALNLVSMGSAEQINAVKAGRLDVAIVYNVHHTPDDLELLALREIGEVEIVLATFKGHRLASKPDVHVADLDGEPMLWPRRDTKPGYYDTLMAACLAHGVSPQIIQQVATHSILLSLVSVGMGVGLVSSSVTPPLLDNIVLRRVSDLDLRFGIHMLWRKADPSPAVARFVNQLQAGQPLDGGDAAI